MNKQAVDGVFSDFKRIGETNEMTIVYFATRFFGTNRIAAYKVLYASKELYSFEFCSIYFDTNDTLLAYSHHLNN